MSHFQRQWKDIEELHRAVAGQRPRILWIHRPIYLHRRRTGPPAMCKCGCESREAERFETREHLDVLIDRATGVRRLRKPHNAEAFDRVAQHAERVLMPVRCSEEQLPAILDRKHKVIGAFGGNRAGKSETAKEFLVDRWAEFGGKGSQFWWVAPSREKTQVGVRKLVTGERTNRFARPAFPPELVRYYPKNELQVPQCIILVDGSRIPLKYAGRRGGNLKGDSAIAIVLDEGTEVNHQINWTILVNRTMESGGQLLTSTTPVAGHWLKELADQGIEYSALTPELEATGRIQRVTLTLSCLRNPWISEKNVQETIESLGGPNDMRVKREVLGQWVAEGNRLWRHWHPPDHMIEGVGITPEEFGYTNITPIGARHLFPQGARLDMLGGWDCNDFPQSLVLGYLAVKNGEESNDPDKWVLLILDEVVQPATIEQWAEFLVLRAGVMRGRPKGWLEKLSIIADKSVCYANARVNRLGEGADADVLRRFGMLVRPPAYQNDQPWNPSIRDRVNNIHRLMHERRVRIHGRCRKLLEAIEGQIADERGLPVKVTKTASDRLSGPADAFGYLAYAVFHNATTAPKAEMQWQ